MIYLDYAATTPVRVEVREAMVEALTAPPGNPSASHVPGRQAAAAVAAARAELAGAVGAEPAELVFTSGATESNNLAVTGAAQFYAARGQHLVTARTEHKSVLDTVRQLQGRGWKVSWARPDGDGCIGPEQVAPLLTDDTTLVSIMHVNNETGAINDVAGIADLTRDRRTLLHVDAAQAVGKLPVDLHGSGADLVSISAHKLGGPAGVGALYLSAASRARVQPQFHGGGQERGLRPGTVAVHQVVGLARACRLAVAEREAAAAHCATLRERFWAALQGDLHDLIRNSPQGRSVSNILNISVPGIDGESLRADLPELAIARGSACTSGGQEPSYVLRAIGRGDALADASLRFSFAACTTAGEVDAAAAQVVASVSRLRALAPRDSVAA